MAHISQLNYEEASLISKNFHTDGDDLVQLHSHTRQRMQALRNEWSGDAAEAFFEEMESELLPALQRVSGALFLGEDILNKIMKIIHEADEETANLFKGDLNDDFGAGLFGAAGVVIGGVTGGLTGGAAGGDDFGAGKFGEALSPGEGDQPTTGQGDPSQPGGTSTDGAGFAGSQATGAEQTAAETPPVETPPAETETAAAGGGGGGGGGGSSQGMQGDLKGLGTGVGGNPQQVSSASGGPPAMADHVYDGSSGGSPGSGSAQSGPAGGSSGQQEQSGGGVAGAAGAAGVLGAAAAGAAKVLKNDSNEPEE